MCQVMSLFQQKHLLRLHLPAKLQLREIYSADKARPVELHLVVYSRHSIVVKQRRHFLRMNRLYLSLQNSMFILGKRPSPSLRPLEERESASSIYDSTNCRFVERPDEKD